MPPCFSQVAPTFAKVGRCTRRCSANFGATWARLSLSQIRPDLHAFSNLTRFGPMLDEVGPDFGQTWAFSTELGPSFSKLGSALGSLGVNFWRLALMSPKFGPELAIIRRLLPKSAGCWRMVRPVLAQVDPGDSGRSWPKSGQISRRQSCRVGNHFQRPQMPAQVSCAGRGQEFSPKWSEFGQA